MVISSVFILKCCTTGTTHPSRLEAYQSRGRGIEVYFEMTGQHETTMQAVLIYSIASKQLILTSRIPSAYAALPSLCLDALSSQTTRTALIWLPGFEASNGTSQYSKQRQRRSYSEDSSSEEEEAMNVESNAWSDLPSTSKNGSSQRREVGACCCVVSRNGLRFAVPVVSDGLSLSLRQVLQAEVKDIVDPELPFAFLEALIAVLEDYFGKLSEAVIKDSFDVVLQVSSRLSQLSAVVKTARNDRS